MFCRSARRTVQIVAYLFVTVCVPCVLAQERDFADWGGCMTGPTGGTLGTTCSVLDDDSDGAVGMADFAAFQKKGPAPCTFGHQYAYASVTQDATGCSAKIRTRPAVLCGEPGATTLAASNAWAGVAKWQGTIPLIWAQAGYERHRNKGSTTVVVRIYAETRAGPVEATDYQIQFGAAPTAGLHEYRCYLISSLFGTWRFDYDGANWHQYTHNGWKNVKGTHYQYEAEIFNKEDQMVGTSGAKCDFTECKYSANWGAFQDASIASQNVDTTKKDEWGAERLGPTSFRVWDKNP